MPRRLIAAALGVIVLAGTLALVREAVAADWNGIEPGVTTSEAVRARFGPPSKESKQKVDGYDTFEWVYEGERAPGGFHKMTLEFGILLSKGYSPNTVRVLRLDPRRFIFTKDMVVSGWGEPDRATTEDGRDIFFFGSGLVVTFDDQGVMATSMFFTVKQPELAPASTGPAPAPPRSGAPPPAKTPPATPPGRR